jgi:hypothetical protein
MKFNLPDAGGMIRPLISRRENRATTAQVPVRPGKYPVCALEGSHQIIILTGLVTRPENGFGNCD